MSFDMFFTKDNLDMYLIVDNLQEVLKRAREKR